MKRFITKVILFTAALTAGIIIINSRREIIPFNNSISLDSKIYELKQKDFEHIDILAIGSSMTMNNLNSHILTQHIGDKSFYNVSSWGQSIGEDYSMIESLVPIYRPEFVIIVTHCGDFAAYGDEFEFRKDIHRYLTNSLYTPLLKIKYLIKKGMVHSDDEYAFSQKDTTTYASLSYDANGGVPLDVYGENISSQRWNYVSDFAFRTDLNSYSSLKKICTFLSEYDAKLILVNTPTRRSYYINNSDDVEKHIKFCDSLVSSYGFTYINELNYGAYPDSLFADCSHLNRKGAEVLTENICIKMNLEM